MSCGCIAICLMNVYNTDYAVMLLCRTNHIIIICTTTVVKMGQKQQPTSIPCAVRLSLKNAYSPPLFSADDFDPYLVFGVMRFH